MLADPLPHRARRNTDYSNRVRQFPFSARIHRSRFSLAFDRDRFEFFGIKLDVLGLPHFVSLDDVVGLDLIPGLRIYPPVLDAIAGLLVELMETDLFPFGRCRNKGRLGTRLGTASGSLS